MAVYVDIRECAVRSGQHVWSFAVDCRSGGARIALHGVDYMLLPLGWREKRNLARFVHLGEAFLERQFLQVSLADTAMELPTDDDELAALVALARWLNSPDGNTSLPLDGNLLATVTLDICGRLQLSPGAFDSLSAAEVEMLWQAGRTGSETPRAVSTQDPAMLVHADIRAAAAMTRIVVLPDSSEADAGAPTDLGGNSTERASAIPANTLPDEEVSQAPAIAAAETAASVQAKERITVFASNRSSTPFSPPTPGKEPELFAGRTAKSASRLIPVPRFRVNLGARSTPASPLSGTMSKGDSRIAAGADAPTTASAPPPLQSLVHSAPTAFAQGSAGDEYVVAGMNAVAVQEDPHLSPAPILPFDIDAELLARPDDRGGAQLDPQQWLHDFANELDSAARAAGIDLEG